MLQKAGKDFIEKEGYDWNYDWNCKCEMNAVPRQYCDDDRQIKSPVHVAKAKEK